jgi:hypothetical protein
MSRPGPTTGVPIASIKTPNHSKPDQDAVAGLAASIREVGLLCPPTVDHVDGGGYILVAGRRRLAACYSLGWERIPVHIRDQAKAYQDPGVKGQRHRQEHSGALLELATIHENLEREHLGGESRRALRERSNELLAELGYVRGSGGARPGAGARKPRTPTRGQADKAAKRSDNQNDVTTPVTNPVIPGSAVTAAVGGVTQRSAQGRGTRGISAATKARDDEVLRLSKEGKSTGEIASILGVPGERVSESKGRLGIAAPRARKTKDSPAIPPEHMDPKVAPAPAEPKSTDVPATLGRFTVDVAQVQENRWTATAMKPAPAATGEGATADDALMALVSVRRATP